jgi:Uma2 family endonuclease
MRRATTAAEPQLADGLLPAFRRCRPCVILEEEVAKMEEVGESRPPALTTTDDDEVALPLDQTGRRRGTATATRPAATVEDLYRIPDHGKAEIVHGELVRMSPVGDQPGRASGAIYMSLRLHEKQAGGRAYPDNVGFRVHLPHRESFSPDASFYTGKPAGMKFLDGAPVFAAEVRSENDYGRAAEESMAAKRADYFAAGTVVVWDVDLLSAEVVRAYHASAPETPVVYRRGEIASAEPAVPGWRMPVDELFD